MSEQDNLRIIRQGWDAWNAHDVEGWLKTPDEKYSRASEETSA